MEHKIEVGRKTSGYYRHKMTAAREFRLTNVELVNIVEIRPGVVDIIGKTRGATALECAPGKLRKGKK